MTSRKTLVINRDALRLSVSPTPAEKALSVAAKTVGETLTPSKRSRERAMDREREREGETCAVPGEGEDEEDEEEALYRERLRRRQRHGAVQRLQLSRLLSLSLSLSSAAAPLLLTHSPSASAVTESERESERESLLLSTGDVLVVDRAALSLSLFPRCAQKLKQLAAVTVVANGSLNGSLLVGARDALRLSQSAVSLRDLVHFVALPLSPSPSPASERERERERENEHRVVVGLTLRGRMVVWHTQLAAVAAHQLTLQEENEEVLHVKVVDDRLVCLSSHGNTYVVERHGLSLSSHALSASRGVVAALLSVSARVFGLSLSPSLSPSSHALPQHVTALSLSVAATERERDGAAQRLLCCVGETLSVWSAFSAEGEERLLGEHSLAACVRQHIVATQRGVDNVRVCVLDAVSQRDRERLSVSVCQEEQGVVTLCVLCAVCDAQALCEKSERESLTASLWLYTLSLSLSENELRVQQHVCLTTRALIPAVSLSHRERERDAHTPRLFSRAPAWRVFVVWTSCETLTLQCAQVDALNSLSQEGESVCVLDSGVRADSVSGLSCVDSVDGVFALKKDLDELVYLSPTLSSSVALSASASVSPRCVGVSLSEAKRDLEDRLVRAVLSPSSALSCVGALRDVFVSWPRHEVSAVLLAVSHRILSQTATGRMWGSDTQVNTAAMPHSDVLQLVHTTLEDKVAQHDVLWQVFLEADGARFSEIAQALCANHEKLHVCAGLSAALCDALLQTQSSELCEASHAQTESEAVDAMGLRTAVDVWAMCVQHCVGVSEEQLRDQGVSAFDHFYSQVGDIYQNLERVCATLSLAQADLYEKEPLRLERDPLSRTAYSTLSIVFSAIQRALSATHTLAIAHPCVLYDPAVRRALHVLCQNLAQTIDVEDADTLQSAFRPAVEEARVAQFVHTLLQGFVDEAMEQRSLSETSSPQTLSHSALCESAVKAMSADWQRDFVRSKSAIELLFSLDFPLSAFSLASRFLHEEVLFETTDRDADNLAPRLRALLCERGECHCGNARPLATAYFAWLEERERYAEILSLADCSPRLFYEFVQTRPHIAWLRHNQQRDFAHAAVACAAHAERLALSPSHSSRAYNTLLSLSKLSALTHARVESERCESVAAGVALTTRVAGECASSSGAHALSPVPPTQLRHTMERVDEQLALCKIERDVRSFAAKLDNTAKLPAHPTPLQLVECCLAMLSGLSDKFQVDRSLALSLSSTALALLQLLYEKHGKASPTAEIVSLAESLWVAVLCVNHSEWLSLSASVQLLPQEEELCMRDTLLLFPCLCDALSAGVLRELLPLRAEMIETVARRSGLTRQRISSQGEIEPLPASAAENARLVHLVKQCVSLAVKECDES